MKIRVHRNYNFPDFYQQSPSKKGIWNDYTFTTKPIQECNFFIALNPPNIPIEVRVPKGNKWLFLQEPPVQSFTWHTQSFEYFDKIFGFWNSSKFPQIISEQTALPWHIQKNYDELRALKPINKKEEISWITSNQKTRSGQKSRMTFLAYLQKEQFPFHLYGRGFQFIADKYEALAPFQYSIAIENYFCPDYWTEKIADCFLSWTMPIYAGATNITDYFPQEAMILIDPNQPREAQSIIKNALAEKRWEKNLDAIEHARNLVLNQYQFFPHVINKIEQLENSCFQPTPQLIPATLPPKRTLLEKIKNVFSW